MQKVASIQEDLMSFMDQIEKDQDLLPENNFAKRSQAIDDIEFHVLDYFHVHRQHNASDETMNGLRNRAERMRVCLEEINTRMFIRIRKEISEGKHRGDDFLNCVNKYTDPVISDQNETEYDCLDLFINGLLSHQNLPDETIERELEMVFFQKTPVRIIFEMIRHAEIRSSDIFVDLGSGLGQVVMLVNLITAVHARGIEIEPAYCEYSRHMARELRIMGTEFIRTDARMADFSSGNIFFLYSPFEGKILLNVLKRLKEESKNRKITIFSYGPCTSFIANQGWLRKKYFTTNEALAEFVNPD